MENLTHTDSLGKANMVDVGHKPDQQRQAVAEGFIRMKPDTLELIRDNTIKKGDVLTLAEIAGIQAGKKTSELIPLCHPLYINKIAVETRLSEAGVQVTAIARCTGKTGVEMEALTAVSIALLTIYDMCKAADQQMVIEYIKLVNKSKV